MAARKANVIDPRNLQLAADALAAAEAVLVAAGAGMGVDSGLPDFRGPEGFWKAYPAFRNQGLSFYDLADPVWFDTDPAQAWGFYGHRFSLYQNTAPHAGFRLLRQWWQRCPRGGFVFTSNVDGHFQAAGFDPAQILECHGSFSQLQCSRPCSTATWSSGKLAVHVDESTFRAAVPLPACPRCGGVSRPNILMFNDDRWVPDPTRDQQRRFQAWIDGLETSTRLVIVEIGAGTAVPTVRWQSETLLGRFDAATLIRINPREPEGPSRTLSIAGPALQVLNQIDGRLAPPG